MNRSFYYFKVVNPPKFQDDAGSEGHLAFDEEYLYIHTGTTWKRAALSFMDVNNLPEIIQFIEPDKNYLNYTNTHVYLYRDEWKSFGVSTSNPKKNKNNVYGTYNSISYLRRVAPPITLKSYGQDGYLAADEEYFYIYIGGRWHKMAISIYPQPS